MDKLRQYEPRKSRCFNNIETIPQDCINYTTSNFKCKIVCEQKNIYSNICCFHCKKRNNCKFICEKIKEIL